jgi:hypothetical protein
MSQSPNHGLVQGGVADSGNDRLIQRGIGHSGNDRMIHRGVGDRIPCARHPAVLTFLRCAACGDAICPSCAEFGPTGACCPTCARRLAKGSGKPGAATAMPAGLVGALVSGLAIASLGGVALAFSPSRSLLIVPFLVMGVAVGEAIGASTRRAGGMGLGLLALGCTGLGPLLGLALARAVAGQLAGRVGVPLGMSGETGAIDAVLIGLASCLAAWRAGGSRRVSR